TQHAEAFHHIVGDEIEIGIIGLAVLGIIVAAALLDIGGQALGDLVAVRAVFLDDIGDVVADHGGEPFHLLDGALLVAEIGGGGGHGAVIGHVPASGLAGLEALVGEPFAQARIGELKHDAVSAFTGGLAS